MVQGNQQKQKNQKLILKKDTDFRKFPTLQRDHIVGVGKKGTMYEIIQILGNSYGWFYKLNNGYYVIKEGDYTLV